MRLLLPLLLLAFVISSAVSSISLSNTVVRVSYTGIAHLDTAISYIGTKEKTGHNDGEAIERFLRSVGLNKGNPYCGAFVSYCLTACKNTFSIRSGLARKFKTKNSIKAKDVFNHKVKIPAGSLVIWEKGFSITGHIGITFKQWVGKYGKTVEANTSSGIKGNQADGDGVYQRDREIQPYARFRITSFTLLEGIGARKKW